MTGEKGEGVKYLEKTVALFEDDLLSDTKNAEFWQWLDQDLLLAEMKK